MITIPSPEKLPERNMPLLQLEDIQPDNNENNFPLFPDFDDISDDFLVKTLTQIEKENVEIQPKSNVTVTKESTMTTINFLSMQNHLPNQPMMYFPNSSVTINYI